MPEPSAKTFRGLNTVTDPTSLGLEWLVQADNVDVTDAGRLVKRTGFVPGIVATALDSAYATDDNERAYMVDAGVLKQIVGEPGSLDTVTLRAGLARDPVYWTEINGQVFFNNGRDLGIIDAQRGVLPWRIEQAPAPSLEAVDGILPAGEYLARLVYVTQDGRMGPASDFTSITLQDGQALRVTGIPASTAQQAVHLYLTSANSSSYRLAVQAPAASFTWNLPETSLGRKLTTADLDAAPLGCEVIQAWAGRLHLSMHLPQQDQSVVFRSLPLGFHLFDFERDFVMVPGHVRMLAATDSALIIGTDREILALDKQGTLARLASYGVVPGRHWARDEADRTVYFWSQRGVCRALPFANLTERQVSVAPGLRAGGAIVETEGQKRFLVALEQGGAAFNSR